MSSGRPDFTPLQDNDPARPRSLADKVLNAIPIIMTVLATLLAGLSSSEMTQAQYHRSLAAQFQSKAGDQWNFFQAKRQRGAIVGGQLDLLRAQAAGDAAPDYLASTEQLAQDLQRVARRAEQLSAVVDTASEAGNLMSLRTASGFLWKEAAAQSDIVGKIFASQLVEAAPPDYRPAVRGNRFEDPLSTLFQDPRPALREELAGLHAGLPAVLDAIDGRKPEAIIAAALAAITADQLAQAIDRVETRAAELDDATRDTIQRFERANTLAGQQAERLRTFHDAARAVERSVDEIPTLAEKGVPTLRQAGDATRRAAQHVTAGAAELVRGVQLARGEYNVRRYECEARYNQVIAGLYEAQVRTSSLAADKHRRRSYLFFYAMLAAQGGVTIATFALAVRQMSTLWGLASLIGLAAMVGGAYVYIFI